MSSNAHLLMAAAALALAACGTESTEKGTEDAPLEDYEAAAKSDSWRSPTEHGAVRIGLDSNATLAENTLFHAWDLKLSGEAEVAFDIRSRDRNLDTVMYLYGRAPGETSWGRYLAKSDDHEGTVFSHIAKTLDAGEYRVIVKGYKRALRGSFALHVSCRGEGCPSADAPNVELPSQTGYTAGCAEKLTTALDSPRYTGDEFDIELSRVGELEGAERVAVEDFLVTALEWADEDELREMSVYLEIVRTEDGAVIEVTTGADWSMRYVFGGHDELLMSFFNDQSPYAVFYCGEEGEAEVAEPGEWCAGAMTRLPHDQDDDRDANGVVDEDAPAAAVHAANIYRGRYEVPAAVPVAYEGRAWGDDYEQGAELTVKAADFPAATYLLAGDDWEMWALFEYTEDGAVAVCKASR